MYQSLFKLNILFTRYSGRKKMQHILTVQIYADTNRGNSCMCEVYQVKIFRMQGTRKWKYSVIK